ncbi:hypothetical protein [Paenibacillus sp. NPDC057934]|uniref:hypothetical protein n=1 Tax=Paenibacillus sp. NPDC057934 TaxID=3346282 RepID=UPI0036D9B5C1
MFTREELKESGDILHESFILPVKMPCITPYQHQTSVLSILEGHNVNYMPWFSQNFLQLRVMLDEKSKPWLDFFTFQHDGFLICPWLEVEHIHLSTLQSMIGDPIFFLINLINLENYIYIVVDGSLISLYNIESKSKFPHPIFIHGYDLSKEVFFVADFFESHFIFAEVPFSELREAYLNIEKEDFSFNGAKLIKFRESGNEFSFDINNMMVLLADYIYTRDTRRRYRSERNYMIDEGLGFNNIYTRLSKDIHRNMEFYSALDITSFHVFYEHKKTLSLILKYLKCEGYIKNDYNLDQICKNSLLLRNTLLKYSFTRNRGSIIRSIELLEKIREEEEALLKRCYEELSASY